MSTFKGQAEEGPGQERGKEWPVRQEGNQQGVGSGGEKCFQEAGATCAGFC